MGLVIGLLTPFLFADGESPSEGDDKILTEPSFIIESMSADCDDHLVECCFRGYSRSSPMLNFSVNLSSPSGDVKTVFLTLPVNSDQFTDITCINSSGMDFSDGVWACKGFSWYVNSSGDNVTSPERSYTKSVSCGNGDRTKCKVYRYLEGSQCTEDGILYEFRFNVKRGGRAVNVSGLTFDVSSEGGTPVLMNGYESNKTYYFLFNKSEDNYTISISDTGVVSGSIPSDWDCDEIVYEDDVRTFTVNITQTDIDELCEPGDTCPIPSPHTALQLNLPDACVIEEREGVGACYCIRINVYNETGQIEGINDYLERHGGARAYAIITPSNPEEVVITECIPTTDLMGSGVSDGLQETDSGFEHVDEIRFAYDSEQESFYSGPEPPRGYPEDGGSPGPKVMSFGSSGTMVEINNNQLCFVPGSDSYSISIHVDGCEGSLYNILDLECIHPCAEEGEVCGSDADCCEGLTCEDGVCVPSEECIPVGDSCESDSDCCGYDTGVRCVDGVCNITGEIPCSSDDDCPTGSVCEDGGCVPLPEEGDESEHERDHEGNEPGTGGFSGKLSDLKGLGDLLNLKKKCLFGDCSPETLAKMADEGLFNKDLRFRNGCTGLFFVVGNLVICDVIWILVLLGAITATMVWKRRKLDLPEEEKVSYVEPKYRLLPYIIFILPLLIGFLTYPWIGVVIALVELITRKTVWREVKGYDEIPLGNGKHKNNST